MRRGCSGSAKRAMGTIAMSANARYHAIVRASSIAPPSVVARRPRSARLRLGLLVAVAVAVAVAVVAGPVAHGLLGVVQDDAEDADGRAREELADAQRGALVRDERARDEEHVRH